MLMTFDDLTPWLLYRLDCDPYSTRWWKICDMRDTINHGHIGEQLDLSELWVLLEKLDNDCGRRIRVLLTDGRVRILHLGPVVDSKPILFEEVTQDENLRNS